MTLILSNDDAEKLITMPECIDVLEEAYAELAEGRGVSRTRSDCFAPTSREDALYSLKSMDGVIPKFGVGVGQDQGHLRCTLVMAKIYRAHHNGNRPN